MAHNLIAQRPALGGPSALTVAAVGFGLVWLLGLAVPVPMLELDASDASALAALTGNEGAVAARSLLIHGLAAVAIVVIGTRLARVPALIAAGLSLAQCALELVLATTVQSASAAGTITEVVNRVDGVKMLALAAVAVAGLAAARRGGLPRWLGPVGAALALSLAASGFGYAFLIPALAPAAYLSLPLLLVFMTAGGLALARRER